MFLRPSNARAWPRATRPEWRSRTSWSGPPWRARLHVDAEADQEEVAGAADAGAVKQKIRTVAGANRLAAIGFPVFACAPSANVLRTLAVRRTRREVAVTWPIWTIPVTLSALRALLTHPALLDDTPAPERLAPYGVGELMRAPRIQTGKYFSFEPARPLWSTTTKYIRGFGRGLVEA